MKSDAPHLRPVMAVFPDFFFCLQFYSRSISSSASGVRGIGFRDSAQDMPAQAYRKPEWAFEMLCYLASQQFEDGKRVDPEGGAVITEKMFCGSEAVNVEVIMARSESVRKAE